LQDSINNLLILTNNSLILSSYFIYTPPRLHMQSLNYFSVFDMDHLSNFSRIKGRSVTATISKRSQFTLLFCGLLGIASVLLVSAGTLPAPDAAASKPDDRSGNQSNRKAPPGMVWIPQGTFLMGTDDVASFPNERSAHRVYVEGFWIDAYDVTNAEFARRLIPLQPILLRELSAERAPRHAARHRFVPYGFSVCHLGQRRAS
jgi:hypothetical protein